MMTTYKLQSLTGASAEIHAHGAHVTSWRTADGVERLFLSRRAEFHAGAAIRGGIPIIFPQFAGLGALPKHGFARTAQWQQVSGTAASVDSVLFHLRDSEATHAIWPYPFMAEYAVTLGRDTLVIKLSIHNTGQQMFTFTAALHTYLRVRNVDDVAIMGLQGLHYRDSAVGGMDALEAASALRIAGEVDRIYFGASRPIQVREPGQRAVECSATGFADAVIWNPGAVKAAALNDLEPEGYRHLLCVEAAAIEQSVALLPGSSWSGTQCLAVI
ncbi:MAG: D-hexose-6-phosphate mutarotase [Steroidobacteraceae bacterium]